MGGFCVVLFCFAFDFVFSKEEKNILYGVITS